MILKVMWLLEKTCMVFKNYGGRHIGYNLDTSLNVCFSHTI